MSQNKKLHAFFRYLRQDPQLLQLFQDMLEGELQQAEHDLQDLAQDALFHTEQRSYALSQHGKVEMYKSLLNFTKYLNRN